MNDAKWSQEMNKGFSKEYMENVKRLERLGFELFQTFPVDYILRGEGYTIHATYDEGTGKWSVGEGFQFLVGDDPIPLAAYWFAVYSQKLEKKVMEFNDRISLAEEMMEFPKRKNAKRGSST